MEEREERFPAFAKLVDLMARLRAPDGCPWDRQQTHKSLRPYLIEEAYEVLAALNNDDVNDLKTELGDLLLQIVFHAQIASEEGKFNIEDVAESIASKLIERHPHIFAGSKVSDTEEVLHNWETIKMEREGRTLLSGIPSNMPALLAAYRVQEKAAGVGFDWKDISGVRQKLKEEWNEFEAAIKEGNQEKMEAEFGDLLFVLVNLGKWMGINAEMALLKTVDKFMKRFKYVENKLKENGSSIDKSTLDEMDAIWNESKKYFD